VRANSIFQPYAGMNKAMYGLLVVIAYLLAINPLVDRVMPAIVAASNKREYAQLVADCETARESEQQARDKSFDSAMMKKRIRQSIDIALLSCIDRDILKNRLLGWGVSPQVLRAIELETLMQQPDVAASNITTPYAD
jgi:hypothetical protein